MSCKDGHNKRQKCQEYTESESESEVVSHSLWPMDCSLPGSSIHGIFQARILEWVAIPFSRRSSWPRDWTWVSHTVGRRFTVWATRKYKKDLNDPNNQDGVITYLEPNILECEVKEALGNGTMNKASGGDGIPVE